MDVPLFSLGIVLLEALDQLVDVIARSQEDGRALVDGVGLNVENGTAAVRCDSARLLDDERHRVALVQQSQLEIHVRRA